MSSGGASPSLPPAATAVNGGDDECPALVTAKVPVVVISGFLGSGKTTFLQAVLASPDHGLRVAVVVNEFAFGKSIEKGLTLRSSEASEEDEWVELPNGCMCCTSRDRSVEALERLATRHKGGLDLILVETAGLTDPRPVAQMFWQDDALQGLVHLSRIITVADAVNIERYLSVLHFTEAMRQIAVADTILLNKVDLLAFGVRGSSTSEEGGSDASSIAAAAEDPRGGGTGSSDGCAATVQRRIEGLLREINPTATVVPTVRAEVKDLRAFLGDCCSRAASDTMREDDDARRAGRVAAAGSGGSTAEVRRPFGGVENQMAQSSASAAASWQHNDESHHATSTFDSATAHPSPIAAVHFERRMAASIAAPLSLTTPAALQTAIGALLYAEPRAYDVVRLKGAFWVPLTALGGGNVYSETRSSLSDCHRDDGVDVLTVQRVGGGEEAALVDSTSSSSRPAVFHAYRWAVPDNNRSDDRQQHPVGAPVTSSPWIVPLQVQAIGAVFEVVEMASRGSLPVGTSRCIVMGLGLTGPAVSDALSAAFA